MSSLDLVGSGTGDALSLGFGGSGLDPHMRQPLDWSWIIFWGYSAFLEICTSEEGLCRPSLL